MNRVTATVISGAAPHSLGEKIVQVLCNDNGANPVLVIDKQLCPVTNFVKKAKHLRIDLGALTVSGSYDEVAARLDNGLKTAQKTYRFSGIRLLIMAAGVYDYGPVHETTFDVRKILLGVNVCGKIEILNSVLKLNRSLGFNSSKSLTIVDIGSLHGLLPGRHRALYGGTKSLGLHLCASLQIGGEVKRAIYIAPGPIDTHMLHRNYWVSKERGSERFFNTVMRRDGDIYESIFRSCNREEFKKQVALQRMSSKILCKTFERYKRRRAKQIKKREGILDAGHASEAISSIIAKGSAGTYVLTNPNGMLNTRFIPFSDMYSVLSGP